MAKTEIDGFTFELEQLPAWEHVEASQRLIKIMGGGLAAIGPLLAGVDLGSGKLDMKVLGVLVEMLRRAPIDESMVLYKQVLTGCMVTSDTAPKFNRTELEPIFNKIFRGKLLTTYKLIAWAITVNFASFFAELKSALPAPPSPQSQEPSASKSQTPLEPAGPVAG